MHVSPIETAWNGVRFRSRLEARWAIFMDSLGVKYVYEPEGYNLDGTLYLPDFLVPHLGCYLEIKPLFPTESERRKAALLCEGLKSNVYIFYEHPCNPWDDSSASESAMAFLHIAPGVDGFGDLYPETSCEDTSYWWCECPQCHQVGIEYQGRSDRIDCGCKKNGDRGHYWNSQRLLRGYERAKGHRFH